MSVARLVVLMGGLMLWLSGCELDPNAASSGGPVTQCERIGQQCKLAPGKIGVCQMDAKQVLTCTSQH